MSVTFTADGLSYDSPMTINMANRNAALVSDALGHLFDEFEWWGEMPASDFLGRVLMALAIAPDDEGMPAYEVPTGGAQFIEGARRPGYLQDRLIELKALAEWAVANNVPVNWG